MRMPVPSVRKQGKQFFFEKKNQKTFAPLSGGAGESRDSVRKSFCFFFQKEALPSLPMLA
jgi:hypothetical protein